MTLTKAYKAVIAVVIAIVVGLVLYNITPSDWPTGSYVAYVKIHTHDGDIEFDTKFSIGSTGYSTSTTKTFVLNGHKYVVKTLIKAPKKVKPGEKIFAEVTIERDGRPYTVSLNQILMNIRLPDGRSYDYFPTGMKGHTITFEIQPFAKAKEAAFVFGSAIVLFIASGVIHYVITGLYLTTALALLGVIYYKTAFYRYMSTIVLVFIAGSALELAIKYNGLDRRLASLLIRIGSTPSRLMVGAALIGAFLSMWMSNTSATYVVLPFIMALLREAAIVDTTYTSTLLVSLPMATSTGGTATIIGTPPNLIAAGYINDILFKRSVIDFVKWLCIGFPAFLISFIVGISIALLYMRLVVGKELASISENLKKARERLLKSSSSSRWSRREALALLTILFLIGLWLTQPIHHINTGIAGVIGLIVFFATGVLDIKKHFKELAWDLMVLFGAGLTLGYALMNSGWTHLIVSSLKGVQAFGYTALIIIGFTAYLIGTVISSHTAATAFLAPLIAPIGAVIAPTIGLSPEVGGAIAIIITTLALNNAIALPISTPPSAIVYGTGKVRMKDLVTYGLLFGIIANILVMLAIIAMIPFIASLLT